MSLSPGSIAPLLAGLRIAKKATRAVLDETTPGDEVRNRAVDEYLSAARDTFRAIASLLRDWQPPGRAN